MKISDKKTVIALVKACFNFHIKHIVSSPGSRNSPLTISFNNISKFDCLSIVDERCAGFFALGIAQQTKIPVIVHCTSGSASLNLAPSIVEAFYQNIPMVIITADRPKFLTNRGHGQTINQTNLYNNYIKKSIELPLEIDHSEIDYWSNEILELIKLSSSGKPGPVHINLPLDEPLYNTIEVDSFLETQTFFRDKKNFELEIKNHEINKIWNSHSKKMILVGLNSPNLKLQNELDKFNNDKSVVILTETSSNLSNPKFINCIDRTISLINNENKKEYSPTLLLTIGHSIISKKIKQFLIDNKPNVHWHIDADGEDLDTFFSLTKTFKTTPENFLSKLSCNVDIKYAFNDKWQLIKKLTTASHEIFLENCPYSDLKVFERILSSISENCIIQMGNSSVVRYIQLFDNKPNIEFYGNRGTSGIEGATSTAIGCAYTRNDKKTIFISGDLSFLYDSNAWWNNYIPLNFICFVINNNGGDIFNIIPGPDQHSEINEKFITPQKIDISKISKAFSINHIKVDTLEMLDQNLNQIKESSERIIIEIDTRGINNAQILKEYFKFLSQ